MDDQSGVVPVSSGVAYYTVRQAKPAIERSDDRPAERPAGGAEDPAGGAEDQVPKRTRVTGLVDVHQRATFLTESQGLSSWEALWQACAEVRRYRRYARCDRCLVVRKGVQVDQDGDGKLLAVCFYCLSLNLPDE
jgi:hypothetical protein